MLAHFIVRFKNIWPPKMLIAYHWTVIDRLFVKLFRINKVDTVRQCQQLLPRDAIVYAIVVCPSIVRPSACLSVRPSHAGIVPKRLNVRSRDQREKSSSRNNSKLTYCMRYSALVFWCQKSQRSSNGVTPMGAPNKGGVDSDRRFFDQYLAIFQHDAR